MAGRDYIHCDSCGERMIYDGMDDVRDKFELRYGNKDAPIWTVKLTCPLCVDRLQRELAEARELLREAQGQLRDQRAGSTLDDRIDAFLKETERED